MLYTYIIVAIFFFLKHKHIGLQEVSNKNSGAFIDKHMDHKSDNKPRNNTSDQVNKQGYQQGGEKDKQLLLPYRKYFTNKGGRRQFITSIYQYCH